MLAKFRLIALVLAVAATGLTGIAHAQFTDSYNFLKAVRERDGNTATELLNRPGTVIVDTRDVANGEAALHIVIERRDATWLRFLLQRAANPDIKNDDGVTPLMLATGYRFVEGAELLLARGARVDETNDSGETPLIRAVQLRDRAMVRLLLKNGADPAKTDNIAGKSALDYARDDRNTGDMLAELTASASANASERKPVFGPEL